MTVSNDPPPTALTLVLTPNRNRAHWGFGAPDEARLASPHRLNRRWEMPMFVLLLHKASLRQPLHLSELNEHLLGRGQQRPLNRSQVQRLVLSLDTWLNTLPARPWMLEHAPRKLSVGPWHLSTHSVGAPRVVIEEDSEALGARDTAAFWSGQQVGRSSWPSPLIVALPQDAPEGDTDTDTDDILLRLARWTGQTLAVMHQHLQPSQGAGAAARLDAWLDQPLTAEARASQLLLRLAWGRQRDEEPLSRRRIQARQTLESLEALLPLARRDLGLAELVRLQSLFNLLLFDPELHASHVLHESQQTSPLLAGGPGLSHWHSLRAQAGWLQAVRPDRTPDQARPLHQTSALHLESLLYWSLQGQSPAGVRQGILLAQRHLPALNARGLCSDETLLAWLALAETID